MSDVNAVVLKFGPEVQASQAGGRSEFAANLAAQFMASNDSMEHVFNQVKAQMAAKDVIAQMMGKVSNVTDVTEHSQPATANAAGQSGGGRSA